MDFLTQTWNEIEWWLFAAWAMGGGLIGALVVMLLADKAVRAAQAAAREADAVAEALRAKLAKYNSRDKATGKFTGAKKPKLWTQKDNPESFLYTGGVDAKPYPPKPKKAKAKKPAKNGRGK